MGEEERRLGSKAPGRQGRVGRNGTSIGRRIIQLPKFLFFFFCEVYYKLNRLSLIINWNCKIRTVAERDNLRGVDLTVRHVVMSLDVRHVNSATNYVT